MGRMKWQGGKPPEDGWYWHRSWKGRKEWDSPFITYIVAKYWPNRMTEATKRQWAGPINEPKEEEE